MNRPNNSNNWFGNNYNNTNFITHNTNVWGGGNNWGGGWGGGWNGGWGAGGWGNPYWGYNSGWYGGGWNNNLFGNAFWGGFTGAMVGNAASSLFNYFPTWGTYGYSSWGLAPVVNQTVYANYTNPYYTAPVVDAGQAAPVTVYNYTVPIATAAAETPDRSIAEVDASQSTFEAARNAFKTSQFDDALKLADQALTDLPGDTSLHEFRALCLFALGRYEESAGVLYAVLTAGPGWNWSTMIGLYDSADTYTTQLRALEAYVKANPNKPDGHFALAYQYMTAGHKEAAASQFQAVASLEPKDQLSANFVKALAAVGEKEKQLAAAPPAAAAADAEQKPGLAEQPAQEAPQPTPPPANFVGNWTAQPDPSLTIALTVSAEGDFTWKVSPKNGTEQTISGKALYLNGEMALTQEQGNPLVGKVETPDPNTMKFSLVGDSKAPALVFKKGA